MSFAERLTVKVGSYLVPQRLAYRLARAVFATQGIGWAGPASGLSDSGEAGFLKDYLADRAMPVVFDVGANVGEYGSAVLSANPRSSLHCFEPSHSHFVRLQARLASAGVHLNNRGLSERTEQLTLHKDADITGLASLSKRDLKHLNIELDISESVQLVTGDEYVAENQVARIDLLKIDVEGWEMSVLRGFRECFGKRVIQCCQFEFGHAHIERRENFRDFWSFFVENGFRLGILKPNGRINFMDRYDEIHENYYATNYVAKSLLT